MVYCKVAKLFLAGKGKSFVVATSTSVSPLIVNCWGRGGCLVPRIRGGDIFSWTGHWPSPLSTHKLMTPLQNSSCHSAQHFYKDGPGKEYIWFVRLQCMRVHSVFYLYTFRLHSLQDNTCLGLFPSAVPICFGADQEGSRLCLSPGAGSDEAEEFSTEPLETTPCWWISGTVWGK